MQYSARVSDKAAEGGPDREALDDDDIVVRGGLMASDFLIRNAEEHHRNPQTRGEWALSVASLPDCTIDEILEQAVRIKNRQCRTTRAGTLREAGYEVVSDRPPHALVMLDGPLTEGTCRELRALFSVQIDNPYHNERSNRGTK